MTPSPISQSEGAVEAPTKSVAPPVEEIDSATGRPKPKPEWKRLFFHASAVSLAAILCYFLEDPHWRGGLTIGALLLATLFELLRKTRFFRDKFNRLVRKHEVATRAASTDFLMAMAICAFAFSPRVAATAFLVTAFADPMARLFGVYFGTLRWHKSNKTFEGSIGFLLVAFAVVTAFMRPTPAWPVALATAFIAAWVERHSNERICKTWFGPLRMPSDNATIPLTVCILLAVFT